MTDETQQEQRSTSQMAPQSQSTPIAERRETFDLSPRNLGEAMEMAAMLADSSIVPKDFMGKPGNILVAVQWGSEIGLKPMQAMQSIAVINGRPNLWGDAVLGLVLASPHCKDVIETYEGTGDNYTARCVAKRHGKEDKFATFSVADAKKAGLLGKAGPWTQYRDRMLKLRARSFALRDQFPDVLKGMDIAEVAMDTAQHIAERALPKTGAEFAEQARAQPETDSTATASRDQLVKDLENNAKLGMNSLQAKFMAIGKDGRKLVGAPEWERIKALVVEPAAAADETAGSVSESSQEATESSQTANETAENADKPTAEVKGDAVTQAAAFVEKAQGAGPTYAQLVALIKKAKSGDDLAQVMSDSSALPDDQRAEILALCKARNAEIGNG